jgi:hypothetical protein
MVNRQKQQAFRRKTARLLLCLAMGIGQGCARPDAFRRTEAHAPSASGEHKLPFHQNSDGAAADDANRPAVPVDHKSANSAPFHRAMQGRSLPAGTLITVQLENSFSITQAHEGDSFAASVAGPVTLDGETVIDPGTPASGRVEGAQSAVDRPGATPDPALVRLVLNNIAVDGRSFAVQTTSLFAKGTLSASASARVLEQKAADYRLLKGRHLTFRLTAPVTFSDLNSVADRQFPDSSK